MDYEPLTKIVDIDGREVIACRSYGTDECRNIHTPKGCAACPAMAAILNQLYAFERIYINDDN